MDLLTPLLAALAPMTFFYIVLGVVLGIVVGAIPGLTGSMLIALSLPFTFGMAPVDAISMLIAMYVGAVSGSLITAVLMRIPGTAAGVITVMDGYPMTLQGKAGRAIGISIAVSFVGGVISWMFLVLLARPLSLLAVSFTQFDFFAMIVMALLLLVLLSKGNMLKGLVAGMLGILVSLPGIDPMGGNYRFTFGVQELRDGFKLLPVLVGLFAGSQILAQIMGPRDDADSALASQKLTGMFMTLNDWRRHGWNTVRSALIGTWIGILPGLGANIGSAFAYSVAKMSSKTPERFGKGAEEGIVASESANNATVGGALVPLIALGIPGSVIDAILLGGLIIHGLQPGPGLYRSNPDFVNTILAATLLANVVMLVVMLVSTRWIARIAAVPARMLIPSIIVLCVVGSFALSNNWFDVTVMLIFSLIGFVMERRDYPLAPMVIGIVLAPLAETTFRTATMYTGGTVLPLLFTPIPIICALLTVGMTYLMFRTRKNA